MKKLYLISFLCLLAAAVCNPGQAEKGFIYSPQAAILYTTNGVILLHHGIMSQLKKSETIVNGDTIKTGPHCFCILKLSNGKMVTISSRMKVTLWTFFNSTHSGYWDQTIQKKKKSAFVYFTRALKNGINYEVETPDTLTCGKG